MFVKLKLDNFFLLEFDKYNNNKIICQIHTISICISFCRELSLTACLMSFYYDNLNKLKIFLLHYKVLVSGFMFFSCLILSLLALSSLS
jgi:hypothetical protein